MSRIVDRLLGRASRDMEDEAPAPGLSEVVEELRFPEMSEAGFARALAVDDANEVLRAVVCLLRDEHNAALAMVVGCPVGAAERTAGVLAGVVRCEEALMVSLDKARVDMARARGEVKG